MNLNRFDIPTEFLLSNGYSNDPHLYISPHQCQIKKTKDGKISILKIIILNEKCKIDSLKQDLTFLKAFFPPIVSDLFDFSIQNTQKGQSRFYLIDEKADFNLSDLILSINENIPKPEPEILQIFQDISSILKIAHNSDLPHGNIHPNNILVFCGKERPDHFQKTHVFVKNNYRLTDWRINIYTNEKREKNFYRAFQAPEMHENQGPYNYKAGDIYSLGLSILYCCGITFKKINPISISEKEVHDFQLEKVFIELKRKYDWKLIEILKHCLQFEINDRWDIEQLNAALLKYSKDSTCFETIEDKNKKNSKPGIIKKLFSGIFKGKNKLGSKRNSKENQQIGSENEIEYNFLTKNLHLTTFSEEEYSTFLNSKGTKTFCNSLVEVHEILNLWEKIKENSLCKIKLELRTESCLGKDYSELLNTIIKENCKMENVQRISFISTSEKVIGDVGKFLDSCYYSAGLMNSADYSEKSINFIHFIQKNGNFGITNEEVNGLLNNINGIIKNDLNSINIIIKSYEYLKDDALEKIGKFVSNKFLKIDQLNLHCTGQNISDEGVKSILKGINETINTHNFINIKYMGLGFGGKKKITDESLIELSKTLISLSSKSELEKLYIYFNSFEISDEGLDSLGTALGTLVNSLIEIRIFITTWDQITDSGILLLYKELFLKSKKLKNIMIGIKSVGVSSESLVFLLNLLSKTPSNIETLDLYIEQMANRNINLEKDFKDKLIKIHENIRFGEIFIKI